MKGVISIFDVANWFLAKEPMTPKKTQKLCYYAEAWYNAFNGEQLFNDTEFEAWVHGPVSPELYQSMKTGGFCCTVKQVEPYNEKAIIPDYLDLFLDEIWLTYGGFDANTLESLTHMQDPWKNARKGLSPLQRSTKKISREDMKKFYSAMMDNNQPA